MSSKFQNVMLIGIAIVVIALFLRRPEKQIPIVQDIQVSQPKERSIIVTGRGEVKAKFNEAEFLIHFRTEDKELAEAKITNEKIYIETIALLQRYGVEVKDISDYLQVEVKTGYTTSNNNKPIGYIAHRALKVTIHSIEELDPLLVDLQTTDKYDIEDIVLRVSDSDRYNERALQLAMENADQKAAAIGRTINREIGSAISIGAAGAYNESTSGSQSFSTLATFFGKSSNSWEKGFSIPEFTFFVTITVEYELK